MKNGMRQVCSCVLTSCHQTRRALSITTCNDTPGCSVLATWRANDRHEQHCMISSSLNANIAAVFTTNQDEHAARSKKSGGWIQVV